MRLVLAIDGERFDVEVDPDGGTVELAGHRHPIRLVSAEPGRTELEVAGERIVLEGWPEDAPRPPATLAINGERVATEVLELHGAAVLGPPSAPPPSGSQPSDRTAGPTGAVSGEGVPVYPPMPGRILEVHVAEGEIVPQGKLLFVLEAMKMRNEITSPVAGRVLGLATAAGTNVRARELLLRIVPGGAPP